MSNFRPVAAIIAALAVLYCLVVLGYVVTCPDIRLRVLLCDDAAESVGNQKIHASVVRGIRIRRTIDLECDGETPTNGDLLIGVGGRPINSFLDFTNSLKWLRDARIQFDGQRDTGSNLSELRDLLPPLVQKGDERWVQVVFHRAGNSEPLFCWLRVQSLPIGETILTFVWFLMQLGIFAVSSLAVWHRPFDRPARLFFAMCSVTLLAFVGGYHWWVIAGNLWLNVPFTACALLVPVISLHFFLAFPRRKRVLTSYPRLSMAVLYFIPAGAVAVFCGLLGYANWLNTANPSPQTVTRVIQTLEATLQAIYVYLIFAAVCFVLMLAALWYGVVTARNAIERSQVRWILQAGMLAVVPVGITLYLALNNRVEFALGQSRILMFLASISFMIAYAVGMIRFRLMLIDQIVSKGTLYYVASFGLTITFGTAVALLSLLANYMNATLSVQQVLQQALSVAAILALIVIILLWLRDRFQQLIDRRFYREKYQLDKALQRMNRAVGHIVDRQSLAERMLASCRDVLGIESAGFYHCDSKRRVFQLIGAEGTDDRPLTIPAAKEFVGQLQDDPVIHRVAPAIRGSLSPVQNTLRLLRAEMVYGLEVDGEVSGLVVVGAKKNGANYTAEDLTFLNALGQITGVALHSARVHQDMGRLNDELQLKVDKIAEQKRQITIMQSELAGDPDQPAPERRADEFRREPIKGNSPAIRRVLETVRKVANSESSVLITGESGTGKELLAQALHENSPRVKAPIVRVHCAALSPGLLESELFGHVKGAFTGAHRDRIGRFEMANGGTLFLDEIGDISLETQIKLLGVLQTRSFEPVGGTRTIDVDVRLITATHQDLKRLIESGRFREDLYYRLNVISIPLPPLRERKEDIFEMALHFLKRSASRIGKRITHIDEEAVEVLKQYDWPGNIRELENVIERAVVLADADNITADDLPTEVIWPTTVAPRDESVFANANETRQLSVRRSRAIHDSVRERQELEDALAKCDGNKAEAARRMEMPRSTFYSKLKKFGIS